MAKKEKELQVSFNADVATLKDELQKAEDTVNFNIGQ